MRLALSLSALAIAATTGLWAGPQRSFDVEQRPNDVRFGPAVLDSDRPSVVEDGRPAFVRQTPRILRPDHVGNVEFEIVYAGSVENLRVFYFFRTGYVFDEFPRVQTTTIGGRTVSIFRPSWTMGEYLLRFGVILDFDSSDSGAFISIAPSTVPLAANGFPTISDPLAVRTMSMAVGNVPVVQIDATAQYSSHVVNLVMPALPESLEPALTGLGPKFYSHFGDDYEQIAYVFREYPFLQGIGASHSPVQNQITGINLPLRNHSAEYGSAGRLEGISNYFYGFNNDVANHELSHQWGHYFDWGRIIGIPPWGIHSPLWGNYESQLTVGGMISSNMRLRPVDGGEWEVVQAPEPTQIPPLHAYAMGRLPASAVPPIDIFENQNRPRLRIGDRVTGATRRVTIDQIIAVHGARVGPTVTTMRQATILVSRDALATPEEMAYWTLYAQRMEDPNQTGMIGENGIGSFRAVSGVTLNTRIIRPAGGPTLTGHETLEPSMLDPRDLAGVVLDTAPRLDVPGSGIFRMQGRIVDPVLSRGTSVSVQHGGGPHLSSPVAPDGSFSIMGSPEMAPGRYVQWLWVNVDGTNRAAARVRNVRIFSGTRIPPPPVAVTATSSGSSVSIRWSPDTGSPPSSYFVDVGSSSGASNIGSFSVTGTTLSAPGAPDGRYYVRVRAANTAGVSAPSAERILVVGCAPPLPPTMLTGVVNGTSVTLAWQPSATSGVTYTVIAGSTSGASNIAQVPIGAATTLTAAVPAGRYFVRVRAVTTCGAADSNEVELIVGLPPVPGAPGNLTHQVTGRTISFSWQAATGANGYVLEAGSQPAASNLAVVQVGNVLAFNAPAVPPGTYYVRVRAVNATGLGPPSNETVVVVP